MSAGRGRLRRSYLAAVERIGEAIEGVDVTLVGEVGALFVGRLAGGEVERVGFRPICSPVP